MPGPFATATEFCEFTGMTLPTDLARLQAILELSSAAIRRYTDQELSVVTGDQVTFGETDRDTLLLPERPVTAATVTVSAVSFTDFTFTRAGLVIRNDEINWTDGAVVTYDHGYVETEPEFIAIKAICIQAAARAFTLNERSASEAMGATLMESAGYSPEIFLTQGEKWQLMDLGKVGVG